MAQGRARAAIQAGRPTLRSPGHPPVNRRAEKQRFWRKITEGLSSEDAAVACGLSQPLGPRWFREGGAMPSISLDSPSGRCLSFAEREEIALLRAKECGGREIARRTGRSPSTISRELRRNAATRGGRLDYRASVAQWHADRQARRPKTSKFASNERLQQYAQDRLAVRSARRTAARSWFRRRAGSGGGTDVGRTGAGRPPGARSRSPADYRSTSPMMSRCASHTRRSTRHLMVPRVKLRQRVGRGMPSRVGIPDGHVVGDQRSVEAHGHRQGVPDEELALLGEQDL